GIRYLQMEFLKPKNLAGYAAAMALLASSAGGAARLEPSEYGLKSVFLYQFCRFMEWPQSAFSSPNDPLVIGIVGDDPFGSSLKSRVNDGNLATQHSNQAQAHLGDSVQHQLCPHFHGQRPDHI